MALTEAQVRRYMRQVLLPDVGAAGQERLLRATVQVDLPAAPSGAAVTAVAYLTAAGVGRVWIGGAGAEAVSADDVASGLLYGADDVGRRRVDALHDRAAALDPAVTVAAVPAGGGPADAVLAGEPDPEPGAPTAMADALVAGGLAVAALLARIAREPAAAP